MNSMNIKKGDKVKVLAGKDKGKEGTILRSLPQKQRVVVEKVNIVKKALRPTQQNPQGGISSVEAPIRVSNVMLVWPRISLQQARRERQEGPRLQEVRQGHRLAHEGGAALRRRAPLSNDPLRPGRLGTQGRKSCV